MPLTAEHNIGTLYVIGTPIGNLDDITQRAVVTLKSVGLVAAEDTRVTKKLLGHLEIGTQVIAIHHHSSASDISRLIGTLKEGTSVALVTDAGTPGISDPGGLVIAAAYDAGIPVVAIPGPSALTAALSLSGLPTDRFTFLGFLPHKKGRETMFREIAGSLQTVAFFESPHRIMKTLLSLKEGLSADRMVVVCRELTKMYEEVIRGSAEYVYDVFTDNPGKVRGEFVIVVSGKVD